MGDSPASLFQSQVSAEDVTIRRSEVALAAYQKKPEYGPASITIENLRTEETSELLLIEKGCWISFLMLRKCPSTTNRTELLASKTSLIDDLSTCEV